MFSKALLRLSNVLFKNGKHQESISHTHDFLKICSDIKDVKFFSEACLLAVKQSHFQGDYEKALDYYIKG